MDWGCVSQLNLAMAIWGAMSGAEIDLWDDAFRGAARPVVRRGALHRVDPSWILSELERQVLLYVALMGVTWLLDVPALIRAKVPDIRTATLRTDPAIKGDESVRAPLQMLANVLNLWESRDVSAALRRL